MRKYLTMLSLLLLQAMLNAQAPVKPYIFLITMDDMNTYMQGYGTYAQAETPNLYAIQQNGTVFTNAQCSAPKCAPSRTSIVTGKDVEYTQVYDNTTYSCLNFRKNFKPGYGNAEVYTLPQYLKDTADYYTYTLGKIFHCYEAYSDYDTVTADHCAKGLSWNDAFVYVEDDIIDPVGDANNEGIFLLKWARLPDTMQPYMEDEVTVDAAIDFLDNFAVNGTSITCGHPFFMGLGIKKPHAPFYVPESFFRDEYVPDIYATPFNKPYNDPFNAFPYNGIMMPPQPNPRWADFDSLGYMGQLFASDNEAGQFDDYGASLAVLPEIAPGISDSERIEIINETERANAIIAYLAGIKFLDYELGRFFTALQSYPDIYNNSVIIITSDHGFSLGTKRHWGKFSMWETDMQVPLIYIDNRNPLHQVCNKAVSSLDIFPTVVDLLDLPEPTFTTGAPYLDGHSLLPLVANPNLKWENPAVGTVRTKNTGGTINDGSCFSQYSVRSNRFHYIKYASNNAPPVVDPCNAALSQKEEELYDIGINRETDPNEWNNLIDDPKYAPVLNYMHQFLPDSALYLQKAFSVDITNAGTTPCFLKNTAKLKLQATLYNAEGTLITGTGYTFKWTNSLTGAVYYGKNYTFMMSSIPPAVFAANAQLYFYLTVIETATGNLKAFNTRTYYINTANNPNATYSLLNDNVALTTKVTGYTLNGSFNNTYWDFGDGTTSEEYLPDTHYYASHGIYTVRNYIQYGNGCLKSVNRTANLAREGLIATAARLYPNPATDHLTIAVPVDMTDAQIEITDMLGQVVYRSVKSSENGSFGIDTHGYAAGTYLIHIVDATRYVADVFEIAR